MFLVNKQFRIPTIKRLTPSKPTIFPLPQFIYRLCRSCKHQTCIYANSTKRSATHFASKRQTLQMRHQNMYIYALGARISRRLDFYELQSVFPNT